MVPPLLLVMEDKGDNKGPRDNDGILLESPVSDKQTDNVSEQVLTFYY